MPPTGWANSAPGWPPIEIAAAQSRRGLETLRTSHARMNTGLSSRLPPERAEIERGSRYGDAPDCLPWVMSSRHGPQCTPGMAECKA